MFLEGTEADIGPLIVELTAFRVAYRSPRGVDLCRPPFDEYRSEIASPVRYDATQSLGADMRAANVETFRYPSARDPRRGVHVACFTPRAFGARRPEKFEGWIAAVSREAVEFLKNDWAARPRLRLPRETFEVDGRLPAPAT